MNPKHEDRKADNNGSGEYISIFQQKENKDGKVYYHKISDNHDNLFVPYLDAIPGANGITFQPKSEPVKDPSDKFVFFENVKQDKFLSRALEGIDFLTVTEEEFAILLVWTAPLVTKINETSVASQRARSILGVDPIQAQGLVKATEFHVDNLISIVESFYKYQTSLAEDKFLIMLKNCVYSVEKAVELVSKIRELGEMWTIFKRDLQLKSGKQYLGTLNKPLPIMKAQPPPKNDLAFANEPILNMDILIRILPFWDIPLYGLDDDAVHLRKMLTLGKSEAKLLCDVFKIGTIGQLIAKVGETLLRHQVSEIENSLVKCFLGSRQKAEDFTKAIARIAFEKHSAHPTYVSTFLAVNRYKRKQGEEFSSGIPPKPNEEVVFHYFKFPLTPEQINSLCFNLIPYSNYELNSLSFIDIRMSDSCIIELKKFLSNNKWKGVRFTSKGLYCLELVNNLITIDAFAIFCEIFFESIPLNKLDMNFPLIGTTLRVLILERNDISDAGVQTLSKFLDSTRSLIMLSLKANNIKISGITHLAKALAVNHQLRYLSLASNPIENYGVAQLGKALKQNKTLEILDLTDVFFSDDACLALNDGLLLNRSLRVLILSNTNVNKSPASLLINTFKNSKTWKVLRWANLKFFSETTFSYNEGKVLSLEFIKHPTAPIVPYIGDMNRAVLLDLCRFQIPTFYRHIVETFSDDEEVEGDGHLGAQATSKKNGLSNKLLKKNLERQQELFRSYFTFVLHYWDLLKAGDVCAIFNRPDKSFSKDKPPGQEFLFLKSLIEKSEYKDFISKYQAMCMNIQENTYNKSDELMPDTKYECVSKLFLDNSFKKFKDQHIYDLEYIIHKEEVYKLKGADTRLLNYQILEELLAYGFDIHHIDKDGIDAVMETVIQGEVEILEYMIEKGADLNKTYTGSQNIHDFCIYHFAVLASKPDLLLYLLENRANLGITVDLNFKNKHGDSAGQLALKLNKFDFVKIISDHGGITELPIYKINDDLFQPDKHSITYFSPSTQPHNTISSKTTEVNVSRFSKETPPLIDAIIRNDEDAFLKLINSKCDINQRDENYMTALHHALFLEREHFAAYLIEKKCLINVKDKANMTPLHVAVIKCSPQMVQMLIKNGAELDSANLDGNTPLHLAAKRRRTTIVKLLLEAGAEPYIFNLVHKTAAQMTEDAEIRDLIRKLGGQKRINYK